MPHPKDSPELRSGPQNPQLAPARRPGFPTTSSSPPRRRFTLDECSASPSTFREWSPGCRCRDSHLSRSLSIGKSGIRPSTKACDICSCLTRHGAYRYSSPVFSRVNGVPENVEMMDHANINAVLSRLSILPMEMKGYLHGTLLKEKLQMIRKTLRENRYSERCERKSCSEMRHRTGFYDRWTEAEFTRSYEFLPPFRNVSSPSLPGINRIWPWEMVHLQTQDNYMQRDGTDRSSDSSQGNQIVEQQMRDLYLQRIADDCRKEFALRTLDKFVHLRLTHYMLLYITACAKALMGDEKTKFLSLFKTDGAFKDKPLNEATYCELLAFVDKESNPAEDVVKALDVSEKSIQEEGVKEGYNINEIGDIRAQMRTFMSLRKPASPFANSRVDDYESLFTTDLVRDLRRTADKQKLGELQSLQKIIKFACFLALKGMDCPSLSD